MKIRNRGEGQVLSMHARGAGLFIFHFSFFSFLFILGWEEKWATSCFNFHQIPSFFLFFITYKKLNKIK